MKMDLSQQSLDQKHVKLISGIYSNGKRNVVIPSQKKKKKKIKCEQQWLEDCIHFKQTQQQPKIAMPTLFASSPILAIGLQKASGVNTEV